MTSKVDQIKNYIAKIPFVQQIYYLEHEESWINGKIQIAFDGLEDSLDFEIKIALQYPLKSFGTEAIWFINKDLVNLGHVMEDGNICIHTSHSIDLEEKLHVDFNSLKNWIIKYYINKEKDSNYEHVIVGEGMLDDKFYGYLFADCEYEFEKGEFGTVNLSYLNSGSYKEKTILNFIVQDFTTNQRSNKCQWSDIYHNYKVIEAGIYYFLEVPPAVHNRFAFKNWIELSDFLPTAFLDFLRGFEMQNRKKFEGRSLPLFLGYRTTGSEVHWQVAMLKVGSFPLSGVPERINGVKTGKWHSELVEEGIIWAVTRNSSYDYFFGRGAFDKKLTKSKILIIGVGAIGSIVAKTLVRVGCRFIDFVDHDVKEPENVCRSEYMFANGITNKTDELSRILSEISPFVNIRQANNLYFERGIKTVYSDKESRQKISADLSNYDIIIDCSTDNDLMYVLNSFELTPELINLSITNHAKELVCAFHPNIYRFVINQFTNVLENDTEDLYNPTGCWSPTFKASYNDIDVLVQLALRRINTMFQGGLPKNNFVIREDEKNAGNFKIVEY